MLEGEWKVPTNRVAVDDVNLTFISHKVSGGADIFDTTSLTIRGLHNMVGEDLAAVRDGGLGARVDHRPNFVLDGLQRGRGTLLQGLLHRADPFLQFGDVIVGVDGEYPVDLVLDSFVGCLDGGYVLKHGFNRRGGFEGTALRAHGLPHRTMQLDLGYLTVGREIFFRAFGIGELFLSPVIDEAVDGSLLL